MNDTCLRALSRSGAQPTYLNLSSTSISSLTPFDAQPAFSARLHTLLLAFCGNLPPDALMTIVLTSEGHAPANTARSLSTILIRSCSPRLPLI